MNSMPSAVWMSAEAARAVLTLDGRRCDGRSGRIVVGRRLVFITRINTSRDTKKLDDEDLDLAVAYAGLQRRQVGRWRRELVRDQLAAHREDGGMTGATKAVGGRIQKEEAALVGADRGHRLYRPAVVDDDALDGTAGETHRLPHGHVGDSGNRPPGAVIGRQRRLLPEWLRHDGAVDDPAGDAGGGRQAGRPQQGTTRDEFADSRRFHLPPKVGPRGFHRSPA